MRPERPRGCGSTRRAFMAALAAAPLASPESQTNQKGQILPAVWKRFSDPATEFEVLRLTNPESASYLPPASSHPISRRGTFLLYAAESGGATQAFRIDLRTGASRQLTNLAELEPASLVMMPDERSFCCFAGKSLYQISFSSLREREIYQVPDGLDRGAELSVSVDGVHASFIESNAGASYVRLLTLARGTLTTAAEVSGRASHPQPRPRRASILYRRNENELWLAHYDGSQNRQLPAAPGRVGPGMWSPDGRTILYLSFPGEPKLLNSLRELTPDTNSDRMIAPTSQFVAFASNGDASVFVGASSNKASPHVLLLLRVTRREFTLCEHKASDAAATSPVFSPGSQRIYFQSDKHGRPAIYSMFVEKLVEKTEQDAEDEPEDTKKQRQESR